MVFVHGEDYGWGAGHPYDPSLLASQGNIIVVTVTFRVGILGTYTHRLTYTFNSVSQSYTVKSVVESDIVLLVLIW